MVNSTVTEDNLSLGKMLNQARLDKNISIQDLSMITKIHKTLIQSLENDEIENLPNRIYVLGFLKAISEALNCDLQKTIYLYEMSLMKLVECNISEESTLIEAPESKIKIIKVKWLLTCIVLVVIILIASPFFIQAENKNANKATTAKVVTSTNYSKIKHQKNIVMPRPPVQASSYNVSLSAVHGVSWISFQVDKNPVRKLTLKKGSNIILKGESVRLVLGNYKALVIKNNKEIVSIKKNINGDIAKINFPQEKNDFTPAQKLIFTLENINNDQSQRL